jgi:hypothetical protein
VEYALEIHVLNKLNDHQLIEFAYNEPTGDYLRSDYFKYNDMFKEVINEEQAKDVELLKKLLPYPQYTGFIREIYAKLKDSEGNVKRILITYGSTYTIPTETAPRYSKVEGGDVYLVYVAIWDEAKPYPSTFWTSSPPGPYSAYWYISDTEGEDLVIAGRQMLFYSFLLLIYLHLIAMIPGGLYYLYRGKAKARVILAVFILVIVFPFIALLYVFLLYIFAMNLL